jgi:hypothetical protein
MLDEEGMKLRLELNLEIEVVRTRLSHSHLRPCSHRSRLEWVVSVSAEVSSAVVTKEQPKKLPVQEDLSDGEDYDSADDYTDDYTDEEIFVRVVIGVVLNGLFLFLQRFLLQLFVLLCLGLWRIRTQTQTSSPRAAWTSSTRRRNQCWMKKA